MSTENRKSIEDAQMPENVLTKGTFIGIPKRRWVEAAVTDAAIILSVAAIPLVTGAKVMLALILTMVTSILFIRGIKNRSVIQILFSSIRYRRRKRKLHLCTPNYVKRIKYEEVANESFVEYVGRLFSRQINQFVDRYAPEEDGPDGQKNTESKQ